MNAEFVGPKCGQCGIQLNEPQSLQPEQRAPCPMCGSLSRSFSVTIHEALPPVRDSVRYKARHGGKGKPFAEGKGGQEFRHVSGKWVNREMGINRDTNEYFERVTDPDTGEILHECREPLTDHRGHGAAKKSRD